MGIRAFVLNDRAALAHNDYCDWIKREIEAARKNNGWDKPQSSSPRLRKWFDAMRKTFPLIGDTHPDDPFGTEYCFFRNVIDVVFASSVGKEGVLQAWRLAEKHGLRLLVGDELLPPTAPKRVRDFYIPVLHGPKPGTAGISPDMCFVVFDPDLEHVAPRDARAWVLERVEAGPWSHDKSILIGRRLTRWIDQFLGRKLDSLISEMRFYRDLIFIRVDTKNASSIFSTTMELSKKLNLPFEVYVNLNRSP